MSEIMTNSINSTNPVWSSISNFPPQTQTHTPSSVAITTPQGRQVYQYPQSSIYNEPNKQNGLNIYVFNPSAIGAPSTYNNMTYGAQNPNPNSNGTPIANTPLAKENEETKSNKKTKKIVKLTDDYIKTLENYLRSKDATIRQQGIKDLAKRFEEDDSRYDNPSLTALLNIALQDTEADNRIIALSTIAAGVAHGDNNTVQLLNELTKSDKLYGQEAEMASKALLNTVHTQKTVEDNSPDKKQNDNIG